MPTVGEEHFQQRAQTARAKALRWVACVTFKDWKDSQLV